MLTFVLLVPEIHDANPAAVIDWQMFYKPKFCCNCGEKIDRVDWRAFTSRRFCDVCAVEQKEYELIPRVIVGVAVLFGIFGIGSYLTGSNPDVAPVRPQSLVVPPAKRAFVADLNGQPVPPRTDSSNPEVGRNEMQTGAVLKAERPENGASREQPDIRKSASDEPVYFCGAMTKKGKPCSRRVKSNQRCWQHAGQPSVVPARKLPDVF